MLLRDPETGRMMGRTAQTTARNYDWPRIADVFLAEIG
jgi:hypothetical protein